MQTPELIELAAVVAQHGPALIVGQEHLGVDGLEDYWAASKCRFDRWGRCMQRLRRNEKSIGDDGRGTTRGLIEEILGSEVLTRIWTAIVTAFDRRRKSQDNEIVARSVYIGHLEMRQRVLRLLSGDPAIDATAAVEINRLRRRAELWVDMLLAPMLVDHGIDEFGFEPARLRQFAVDLRRGAFNDPAPENALAVWQCTLRTAVRHASWQPAPNDDLNAKIASAVLKGFSATQFDAFGTMRSLWMIRLAVSADDTERLVDELIRAEQSPIPGVPSGRPRLE